MGYQGAGDLLGSHFRDCLHPLPVSPHLCTGKHKIASIKHFYPDFWMEWGMGSVSFFAWLVPWNFWNHHSLSIKLGWAAKIWRCCLTNMFWENKQLGRESVPEKQGPWCNLSHHWGQEEQALNRKSPARAHTLFCRSSSILGLGLVSVNQQSSWNPWRQKRGLRRGRSSDPPPAWVPPCCEGAECTRQLLSSSEKPIRKQISLLLLPRRLTN